MLTADQQERLRQQLILHEDLRLKPYHCTAAKQTIGVGYNISDRGWAPLERTTGRSRDSLSLGGLTREEALAQLDADITMFVEQIRKQLPRFDQLDAVRQRAIIDFVFNLGTVRAAAFKNAIAAGRLALEQTDPALRQACWDACAFHMLDSAWSRQVDDGLGGRHGRADRLCGMIRTGKDYAT